MAEFVAEDGLEIGAGEGTGNGNFAVEFADGVEGADARHLLLPNLGAEIRGLGQSGELGEDSVEAFEVIDFGERIESGALEHAVPLIVDLVFGPAVGFGPALNVAGDGPFAPESGLLSAR